MAAPLVRYGGQQKALALCSRSETRDYIDILELSRFFPLEAIAWAACDKAEEEIIKLADTHLDMPIGVAFVNEKGEPGWIGSNPDLKIHYGSLRGCWPVISSEKDAP